MLIIFANNQPDESRLHGEDGRCIAIATFHEVDEAVGKAGLYLTDVFSCRVTRENGVTIDMQLYFVTDSNLGKNGGWCDVNQIGCSCFAGFFDKEAGINALYASMSCNWFFLQ